MRTKKVGIVLPEKAGLMSHAVKTERTENELLRVSVVRSGTRPVQMKICKEVITNAWKPVTWL